MWERNKNMRQKFRKQIGLNISKKFCKKKAWTLAYQLPTKALTKINHYLVLGPCCFNLLFKHDQNYMCALKVDIEAFIENENSKNSESN